MSVAAKAAGGAAGVAGVAGAATADAAAPCGAALGIDLGGTKIEAALLDAAGTVLWTQRLRTPAGDYAATVRAIAALVAAARGVPGNWFLHRSMRRIACYRFRWSRHTSHRDLVAQIQWR